MIFDMDNFAIHLEPLLRRYPGMLPLRSVGRLKRKSYWVDRTFTTYNFSFILKGKGVYRTTGKEWQVEAPCVITQWPGVPVAYGPDGAWDELYLMYDETLRRALEARRFVKRSRPWWAIREFGRVTTVLDEFSECALDADAPGMVDRIDALGSELILESLLGADHPQQDPAEAAVRRVQALLASHSEDEHDFEELAVDAGYSPSTFRRHWNRLVQLPPHQYLLQCRVLRAQRLLAETDDPVGEIAERVGFEDALYFSRRFRQATGLAPTRYRDKYRVAAMVPREKRNKG